MPKPSRSSEEIESIRRQILDAAVAIIYTDGFHNLSMRKIGAGTGMTAANIYNYFSGKDEIYLAIQTRGFDQLHETFARIETDLADPRERIRRMIRAYIDFGRTNPDQYEIMFTRNTPKYADYVGTPLEPAARIEKETALRVAALAERSIAQAAIAPDHALLTLQVWTALHGLVSLINSRVLQEVDPNTDRIVQSVENDLMARFNAKDHQHEEAPHGGNSAS